MSAWLWGHVSRACVACRLYGLGHLSRACEHGWWGMCACMCGLQAVELLAPTAGARAKQGTPCSLIYA